MIYTNAKGEIVLDFATFSRLDRYAVSAYLRGFCCSPLETL